MQSFSNRHAIGVVIGIALGLFLGAGLQAHSKPPPGTIVADIVRARAFDLIGTDGNTYATLRQTTDGCPSLDLRDKGGVARASLSIVQDGRTLLDFRDSKGNTRQVLQINVDGSSALMLLDADTHARADFGIKLGGGPYMALSGPTGSQQASMVVDPKNQQSRLDLRDSEDKRRASLVVTNGNGSPNLFLAGTDPLTNATLSVWDDRLPTLLFEFQNGKRSLNLGEDQRKQPSMFVKNNDVFHQFPPQK
jgi:hypothetical protein